MPRLSSVIAGNVTKRRGGEKKIRDRKKIASIGNNNSEIVVINYSDEDKLKRFQLSFREG